MPRGRFKNIFNLILAVLGMVLKDIFVSFVEVVTKPWILIPMIIVMIISTALSSLSTWVLEKPYLNFILYFDTLPTDNLLGTLLFNYPLEIIGLAVIGIIMSTIGVIGIMSIVRMVQKVGFIDSINESTKEWVKALAISIIFWIAFVIIAAVFTVVSLASDINAILGGIVITVFFIILFVILVKVVFTFPALMEKDAKKAIQESWKFTNKRFWGTLALVLISAIISFIVATVVSYIGITLGGYFEIPLDIIGETFASTYFIVVITNYFYSK